MHVRLFILMFLTIALLIVNALYPDSLIYRIIFWTYISHVIYCVITLKYITHKENKKLKITPILYNIIYQVIKSDVFGYITLKVAMKDGFFPLQKILWIDRQTNEIMVGDDVMTNVLPLKKYGSYIIDTGNCYRTQINFYRKYINFLNNKVEKTVIRKK